MADKKWGVPLGTPPDLRAVSRLRRLLQGVNAGAEVNVERGSIHHQGWNGLHTGGFGFFHAPLVGAAMRYM